MRQIKNILAKAEYCDSFCNEKTQALKNQYELNGDHKKVDCIGIMKLPEENIKHHQCVQ